MPKTYTTISGDMWDSIALKTLGREADMDALLEANEEQRETAIFPAGVVLTIPDVSNVEPSILPPWRR